MGSENLKFKTKNKGERNCQVYIVEHITKPSTFLPLSPYESHITSLNLNNASPLALFAAKKSSRLLSRPSGPFKIAEKHNSTNTFNSSYVNGSPLPACSAFSLPCFLNSSRSDCACSSALSAPSRNQSRNLAERGSAIISSSCSVCGDGLVSLEVEVAVDDGGGGCTMIFFKFCCRTSTSSCRRRAPLGFIAPMKRVAETKARSINCARPDVMKRHSFGLR